MSLPFSFSPDFDGTQHLLYRVTNLKTGSTKDYLYSITGATVSNTQLVISNRNWYSYEPTAFSLTLYTSDLLYKIYEFGFTRQNCGPSSLSISSYEFTGLPEESGFLSLTYNRIFTNITNYFVEIAFPDEYPESISITSNSSYTISNGSPRTFQLTVPSAMQPVTIKVWGFTNILTSGFFRVSVYDGSYLVSSNSDLIKYDYNAITDCEPPCKICLGGDGATTGQCLQCYSSSLTSKYILNLQTEKCVSTCPSGTFPNTLDNTCEVCPLECQICTSATHCSSCSVEYYLLNNNCLTDCPDTYYPSDAQQTC